MSNPFLFDDDDGADAANDPASNPFLQESNTEVFEEEQAENPFLAQASNPFAFDNADDGEAEKISEAPVEVTPAVDTAMSFFGTTITDDDEQEPSTFVEPTPSAVVGEPKEKKSPPSRPTPPQTTQDLIFSVTEGLDQASSHLLDRIPVTRTPSPVSMRDLHSPSPTPECADLLMSDSLISAGEANASESVNPFADLESAPVAQSTPSKAPVRPTPPRPTPPSRPPTAVTEQKPESVAQQNNEADLFDMFGTNAPPKPPAPKSNQDILSLFSTPKVVEQPQQPDLLTSDIFAMEPVKAIETNLPVEAPAPAPIVTKPKPPPPPQRPALPPQISQKPTGAPVVPPPPVVAASEPAINTSTRIPKAPSIENVPHQTENAVPNESVAVSSIKINDEPYNDITANDADKSDTISDNSSAVESSIRTPAGIVSPGVATPFYTGGPDAQYLDRSQSPVSKEEIINSYINDTSYVSPTAASNPFGLPETKPAAVPPPVPPPKVRASAFAPADEFDAFAAKFDSVKKDDALLDGFGTTPSGYKSPAPADAWGDSDIVTTASSAGFEAEEGFDSFLAMQEPPEEESPKEMNVFIRPKDESTVFATPTAILAPPPSRGSQNSSLYNEDSSPRFGQSDKSDEGGRSLQLSDENKMERTGSQESPSTPLFDDDVSQPLEDFPRITYTGEGWDMHLRQPNKKKITAQRFWKKILMKVVLQGDIPVIQLFNQAKDKDPFQELPLQGCYSVSEISAQPFDQFGKIFTLKLQYIFYKERAGIRPGQVTKAERITNKLSQFAAYAIQGDYQGVKEFGSDLKKLGLPVEHAPQVSELFKIGSHNYEDLKQFSVLVEEHLFKFNVHRDRALTYKMEEVQVTAVDEIYVEQTAEGHVTKQIARVRLFFLAFLTGMPTIELGVNDMWRQGKEVVGRHDIIPVATEEWIRLEGVEFHACVQQNEYERSRLIRFQPPDACYIELMRFRVRPPKNRELPLQLKAVWCVTGKKVELRADILVPGFASRKLGQIPCEDVSIRFPIPECWIYLFRVEKHFRYGSVKSAHRRTGKIKGIERLLGTVDQLQESLIEVTSGQAKYEHHHRSIVWRCPRLPKDGQGAYTTHQMVVRMALTSYDQIPDKLAEHCFVEFTMPHTTVSHTTVRSVSVQDSDSDDPPEKYVRYLARHEYRVGIEYTTGESQNPYLAATAVKKPVVEEKKPEPVKEVESESDSDSN